MSMTRRVLTSLLISLLAFTGFAIVAFSGFFPWIEAQFYSPRIISELQDRLDTTAVATGHWKQTMVERFQALLADPSFEGTFSPVVSRQASAQRAQLTKQFLLGLRGGGSLRILDQTRTKLHFSTDEGDLLTKTDFSVTYRNIDTLSGVPDLKATELTDGQAHQLVSNNHAQLFFLYPWKDSKAVQAGYALFSVAVEDLRLSLVEQGNPLAQSPLIPLGPQQFLYSLSLKPDSTVIDRINGLILAKRTPPVQRLALLDGKTVVALIHKAGNFALVPLQVLELNAWLKAIILVSFFTLVFLITFLLFNWRGEPLAVVSRKVKRFQLQVVKQYLDLKEQDKIQSLRDELQRHSEQIRSDVRKSLGRVRKKDSDWVNQYIDQSWAEVLQLLGANERPAREGPEPGTYAPMDWQRLEKLLHEALAQGRFVVSGAPVSGPTSPRPPILKPGLEDAAEDLEELTEAEEVEELEELDEVEEIAEVEELEEAEAVEELSAELEGIEDAEEVEELEELVEDTSEVGASSVADPDALEELEAATDSDEPSFAEELLDSDGASSDGLFRARYQTDLDGPITELAAEEDSASTDLEAYEELEELPEWGDEAAQVQSISLDTLDASWKATDLSVFEEEGEVVSLSEDLFKQPSNAGDEFGQLVSEVIAGSADFGFVPMEDDQIPQRAERTWRWTGGGFDWDLFAGGTGESDLYRAFSDLLGQCDAFAAAILTETDGGWTAHHSIGFSDAGKESLTYPADSSFSQKYLANRALHVFAHVEASEPLSQVLHERDIKYMKTLLAVPILFHHEAAWLLLGLKHDKVDAVELLRPRVFS